MYESGPRSGGGNHTPTSTVAVRKSPSLAMIVIEHDRAEFFDTRSSPQSSVTRCKTPHRKVNTAIRLCVGILLGILLCTIALFISVSFDPSTVSEDFTFRRSIRNHKHLDTFALGYGMRGLGDEESTFGSPALEGLGMLFRRGRRAMPQLLVAHLVESTTPADLRLFLRGLHRSGMPARADVVLLFPWRPLAPEFVNVIREEESYFWKFLAIDSMIEDHAKLSVFNSGAYTRALADSGKGSTSTSQAGSQESIWGRKRDNNTSGIEETAPNFGAIVGFDMQELDPDDALSGFLDFSPAVLRRWLCYQILLGMVRHRYRHVFLTEVTGVFILADALAPLKRKDASLHLFSTGHLWLGESQTSEILTNVTTGGVMESVYMRNTLDPEDKSRTVISTGVIFGATRQVRVLAAAMATEIVRVALLRQSRSGFRIDTPFLSFLVHKSSVLGKKVASHLHVHESGVGTVNVLPGPTQPGSAIDDFFRRTDHSPFAVLQGLKYDGVSTARRETIVDSLRRDICRSHRDIGIYADCSLTTLPASHTE